MKCKFFLTRPSWGGWSFGDGCMGGSEAWSQLCHVLLISQPCDTSIKALQCEYARWSLQIQTEPSGWLSGSSKLSAQLSQPYIASGLSAVQNMGSLLNYFRACQRRVLQMHRMYQRLKICAWTTQAKSTFKFILDLLYTSTLLLCLSLVL